MMDVTIEFPKMTDLLCEMADVFKKLEATRAELAAERAKPRGGVAWAAKRKKTGEIYRGVASRVFYLFESRSACEEFIAASWDVAEWEPTPYPIGDGADELKAAIERAEKAEAEVAAWKAAAKHRYQDTILIESPADLIRRIDNLKTDVEQRNKWVSELKAELAALKASPAEVPPLDKWRVLATAMEVARRDYQESDCGTEREAGFRTIYWSIKALFKGVDLLKNEPYLLKD